MWHKLHIRLTFAAVLILIAAVTIVVFQLGLATSVTEVTTTETEEMTTISSTMPLTDIALVVAPVALIASVMLAGLIYRALQPVNRMAMTARQMMAGELNQRILLQPENELGELARSLNTMAGQLQQQDKLRRQLVNDVAHELRGPLTNIQCGLESIQDGLVSPDSTALASLHEETMLLKRLVTDLQELALTESGQLDLVYEPIRPVDVVTVAVQAMQTQIQAKDIVLRLAVAEDLPPVSADAGRIQQVLQNILGNALHYTPAGGHIVLTANSHDNEMVFRIQDSGEGIPSDKLADVFERFYRVDPSRSRETGGSGLGLAIVKQLVQAHHGRVWAESRPGKGAAIIFTLPLDPTGI
jgi:two-component system sensor histidine kinase BaeS